MTRSRSSFPIRRCSCRTRRPSRPRRRAPKRSPARRTRPPAADETKNAAAAAAKEAASVESSLRKLERLKTRADAALANAEKALAAAKTDKAKSQAEDRKQKAAAKAEELQTQLDAAKANAKSKLDAAAAAKDAAKAAETKKADTAKAASEAKLALEPVSVFISRATQKLYVRRNTHKPAPDGGEVFDATIEVPVTIRDPDKRIGTHVFTAMARNDAGLRWTAVTIDSGDDAKDALDRITIPQDVLDRIGQTALPRSSIIISDEPLHSETNYRTEFVVALNNQPQGGLLRASRRPISASPTTTAGATTTSTSFSNAVRAPELAMRPGAAASTIFRSNGAAGGRSRTPVHNSVLFPEMIVALRSLSSGGASRRPVGSPSRSKSLHQLAGGNSIGLFCLPVLNSKIFLRHAGRHRRNRIDAQHRLARRAHDLVGHADQAFVVAAAEEQAEQPESGRTYCSVRTSERRCRSCGPDCRCYRCCLRWSRRPSDLSRRHRGS